MEELKSDIYIHTTTNVEIMITSENENHLQIKNVFAYRVLGRKWVTPNNKQCICRDTLINKFHFRLRVFNSKEKRS